MSPLMPSQCAESGARAKHSGFLPDREPCQFFPSRRGLAFWNPRFQLPNLRDCLEPRFFIVLRRVTTPFGQCALCLPPRVGQLFLKVVSFIRGGGARTRGSQILFGCGQDPETQIRTFHRKSLFLCVLCRTFHAKPRLAMKDNCLNKPPHTYCWHSGREERRQLF